MIDTATLVPQIEQLAQLVDDQLAAELEETVGHAFSPEDTARWPSENLRKNDPDEAQAFAAGMVWAIVLARRGGLVRDLVGPIGTTVTVRTENHAEHEVTLRADVHHNGKLPDGSLLGPFLVTLCIVPECGAPPMENLRPLSEGDG